MIKTRVAVWAICAIAFAAFGFWRYSRPAQPRAHVALLYDRSESLPQDCDSVAALGQRALSLPNVRDGSTLTLFVTSDRTTRYEPLLVVTYPLSVSRLVTENRSRAEERQAAFVEDLRNRCLAFSSTKSSPVLQSIKRVVAHLSNMSDPAGPRYLLIRTDLQETVEPALENVLDHPGVKFTVSALTIGNEGVEVYICGGAQIVNNSSKQMTPRSRPVDWIQSVWSQLFTAPGLVHFQPFCPTVPAKLASSR